ncbi:MAG TPA: HlyD family efflux transporter periplasmic adaptor subunit [Candidatus Binatia bacterium]|nr:HlyD family efflux transporter periplasmic adaptor subunit [Candidatus Binatia bacterium]
MKAKWIVVAAVVLAGAAAGGYLHWGRDLRPTYYTGFVEGEERILRSEVSGRVLEVRFGEGAGIEAGAVVAVLDARDVETQIESKKREIAMYEAEIRTQAERATMIDSTSKRDVSAQRAELEQAEAALELAEKTFVREQALVETGASTAQLLDEARSKRDQARSAVDRARQMLARAEASLSRSGMAESDLEMLRRKRELALAQLAELDVKRAKYEIHAPAVSTIVQTQYIWPGELAQPGTAVVSVIDPKDKYVQIYVPVADLERFRVGRRVEIELDSRPGRRVAGEVSFVADKANFTPEKIETRSDRMGQVYRAKIRILEDVESFQPGTEGNVYVG